MEAEKRDPKKIPAEEMTAADLHELSVGWAVSCFDGSEGGIIPTFTLLANEGITMIASPWSSEVEKNLTFEFVASKLAEDNSHAYSLCHELYMARHEPGTRPVLPSRRAPSERDEVLMISTYGRGGECMITRFLITPARQGHEASLGPRVDEPEEEKRHYQGRLFNLFRSYAERMADNDAELPIDR